MLSKKKCKEILDNNEEHKCYPLEEIDGILEVLFILSKIDIEIFNHISENERSDLHKGVDRRAS